MGNNFDALKGIATELKENAKRRKELEDQKDRACARIARETQEFLRTMRQSGVKSAPDVRLKGDVREVPIDFAQAMREAGVEPLEVVARREKKPNLWKAPQKISVEKEEPERSTLSDEADSQEDFVTDDEGLSFHRPDVGPDVARDLRRGRWPVLAQVDLHGMFVEEAREAVADFLKRALTHEITCVRIVHGKGNGSPQGHSVLREKVRRWVKQCPEVIAFAEPYERDGGAGATIIRLRLRAQDS